jgi:hypothetical protein
MGVTAIKQVINRSRFTINLSNTENPDKFRNGGTVNPNSSLVVDMWIPWATTSIEFLRHHITIQVSEGTRLARVFKIHQRAGVDGDFVRVAEIPLDDAARSGFANTHINGDADVNGDRCLIVGQDGSISLRRV